MNSTIYDTIVSGGGSGGMSAAYHLAKAGANALLVDRHHVVALTEAIQRSARERRSVRVDG